MTKRLNISSGAKWEDIVGYSRAVRVGNVVEVAGTTAVDDDGNLVGVDDMYVQSKFIFEKIEAALKSAGASMSDVVRTRMLVTDISRWEEVGRAHGEVFRTIKPAATMVEVNGLIGEGMLIEIEATARVAEMSVAFATCAEKPEITADSQLVLPHLAELGIEGIAAIWNDPSIDWSTFDAVLISSTWDYHTHPDEFAAWLTQLDTLDVPTLNPAHIIRWNMHKKYLRELQAKGVTIVPTQFIDKGADANLAAILAENGWQNAVVKPAISASAFSTWRTSPADAVAQQDQFSDMIGERDVLVQPFIKEIQTVGEWSLLFINKQFSHAIVKTPVPNEFRCQKDFGGSVDAITVDAKHIATAQSILDCVDAPLAYARVDGILIDDQFTLMELELIEPDMFFAYARNARKQFAITIRNML